MKLDPLIVCRVLYEPRQTFQGLHQSARFEVLIPVVMIAAVNTTRAYMGLPQRESLGFVGLLAAIASGSILMLSGPFLMAVCVFLLRRQLGNGEVGLGSLFTALVLCAFPIYISTLVGVFAPALYFGLGDVFRSIRATAPFLYGTLETVTPFFMWTTVLWWIATTVLLRPGRYQRLFLIAGLVLVEALTNGIYTHTWRGFLRS